MDLVLREVFENTKIVPYKVARAWGNITYNLEDMDETPDHQEIEHRKEQKILPHKATTRTTRGLIPFLGYVGSHFQIQS